MLLILLVKIAVNKKTKVFFFLSCNKSNFSLVKFSFNLRQCDLLLSVYRLKTLTLDLVKDD